MQTLDLAGKWQLSRAGKGERIPATVPGCVHLDLLGAKKIEDPYYRDNELAVQWIGRTDWVYSRSFDVTSEMLAHDRVLLRCEGLDTLATVKLNGRRVGRADNMFRVWEFDVKAALRRGANTIEVRFDSPLGYAARRNGRRNVPFWSDAHKADGGPWVRKEQCNFGWDWGPTLLTCGIWRDLGLVGFDTARLADVRIDQDHTRRGGVGLSVRVEAETTRRAKLEAVVTVGYGSRTVAEARVPLRRGKARADLLVKNPKLWWPNGMGEQPLYDVTVDLVDASEGLLDTATRRIGLRTLELQRKKDRWGESFQFAVNRAAFFAKGANWIPADTFAPRVTAAHYADLLHSAADAHMNMLRVWGGGIYEDDRFYDLCDELGICIWQDFMFACAAYPTFDDEFVANVASEAEDNIRRLRHHPCLALWCGNNELEMGLVGAEWNDRQMSWADYGKLFDRLLPRLVARLDGATAYWPSSPHSPRGDRADCNNPDCGDAHLWSVWHGKLPFEWYRSCTHRFNSEFGFQSFPEPKTVRGYTLPADRNVTARVMEHHQRSGIGNSTIMTYMLDWFRLPTDFDMTLWLSQVLQGMAIKYAVENWRRSMPRGMGTLYWQLNDCWPVASWSSIDSHGRWKALQYMARHFYAPLLVSGVEDLDRGTVDLHVTSDRMTACNGRVSWTLTDTAGKTVAEGGKTVRIAPRASARVETLKLRSYFDARGPRDLLLWLELAVGQMCASTNLVHFARPKRLELGEAGITTKVRPATDGAFVVTVRAKRPALWTWLELTGVDARWSENFFHLRPGEAVRVLVAPAKVMTADQLARKLKVRSLIDTYA